MKKENRLLGYITEKQVFLFPDTELAAMPKELNLVSAKNGKVGIQILFECLEENGTILVEGEGFEVEYFQMIDVPVNRNTSEQGGSPSTILVDECPPYAIRKAPFQVYDCLRPLSEGVIKAVNGRVSAYVCLAPMEHTVAGEYDLNISIRSGDQEHICSVHYQVFPVMIEENRFSLDTWFSLESIEKYHNVKIGTPEFLDMLRKYAKAMRRAHQNVFAFKLKWDRETQEKKPYHFDFEYLKPYIDIFYEEGFDTLEIYPLLLKCGLLPDGTVNDEITGFTFEDAPDFEFDTEDGYEFVSCMLRDFAAFLRRHNFNKKLIFRACDEPDGYNPTYEIIQKKRKEYFMISSMIRRYLPGVKIAEAIYGPEFAPGIDILTPVVNEYEKHKEWYDKCTELGHELYSYVCCGPRGFWLNRFLDVPLVNGRLLFWGCAANRITGWLTWGFNMFECTPNPFESTLGIVPDGSMHSWPCGDAFYVYPGDDGPWLGMRLEAERRGFEDAALLRALYEKDPQVHDELVAKVFTSFSEYDNDVEKMELVHRELLERLSRN